MYNKHHECVDCGAVYKVKHDLDEEYYKATFCPFCGHEEDLDEDAFDSFDDDDE